MSNPKSPQWMCSCCGCSWCHMNLKLHLFKENENMFQWNPSSAGPCRSNYRHAQLLLARKIPTDTWHLQAADKPIHGLWIHPMTFEHRSGKTTGTVRPQNKFNFPIVHVQEHPRTTQSRAKVAHLPRASSNFWCFSLMYFNNYKVASKVNTQIVKIHWRFASKVTMPTPKSTSKTASRGKAG